MPDAGVAELTRVDWWIYDTLYADAQIQLAVGERIYVDQASQFATEPMIVFQMLGASDKALTSRRRLSTALYLVRAIRKGSTYSALETLADRIEAVLQVPDTGTIVREVNITSCNREQGFKRMDDQNGVPYVHLGGIYRVRFQSAFQ